MTYHPFFSFLTDIMAAHVRCGVSMDSMGSLKPINFQRGVIEPTNLWENLKKVIVSQSNVNRLQN